MQENDFIFLQKSHTIHLKPVSSISQSGSILVLVFTSKCATSIPSSHKNKIIALKEELIQKYKQEYEELRQKIKEWEEWKA